MSGIRENTVAAASRWARLEMVQTAYPRFGPFLHDMMAELGFDTSEMQMDIGLFLETGPLYRMIQAQRGQAKTTITAIYAVWRLIHAPKARVVILSAGENRAQEISTLIVNLIRTVDVLEPLRPDRAAGDRTSVEAFDIHHSLKGVDKSPSVQCYGILGGITGARADILIADDVEVLKNSLTPKMRETLMAVTRDFTSICSEGDIIYLGTPQSTDSIYNTLPSRGYAVRIWPGRYPTPEQLPLYGESLAPIIRAAIEADPSLQTGHGADGMQGAATDFRLTDENLTFKELDQGKPYFQLQHMLLTALSDALRYPLKVSALVGMVLQGKEFPSKITRGFGGAQVKTFSVGTASYTVSLPHSVSETTQEVQGDIVYVDPAAGGVNADETAFCHMQLLNSMLLVRRVSGVPGGYEEDKMRALAKEIIRCDPKEVVIEKNMGWGAFAVVFAPILKQEYEAVKKTVPPIRDDAVSGQKELRIINTLEPIMGRGSLIICESVAEEENLTLARYPLHLRQSYSFFFQLAKITRDRDCLSHDDRLDAVAGAAKYFLPALVVDQDTAIKAAEDAQLKQFMANPLGYPAHVLNPRGKGPSAYRTKFRQLR